jgi:Ca2+-transporting ATPase
VIAHRDPAAEPERPTWHGMDAAAVVKQLRVEPDRGLASGEAAERLRTHGPNKLAGAKKESAFHAFLRQYQDFMQIILLGAA